MADPSALAYSASYVGKAHAANAASRALRTYTTGQSLTDKQRLALSQAADLLKKALCASQASELEDKIQASFTGATSDLRFLRDSGVPRADDPTYITDILSVVEAIMEARDVSEVKLSGAIDLFTRMNEEALVQARPAGTFDRFWRYRR